MKVFVMTRCDLGDEDGPVVVGVYFHKLNAAAAILRDIVEHESMEAVDEGHTPGDDSEVWAHDRRIQWKIHECEVAETAAHWPRVRTPPPSRPPPC